MNIHDLPGPRSAHIRRNDLHVAGQHDEIGACVFTQHADFLEGFNLRLRRDRDVMKGNALAFDHAAEVVVI